MKGNEVGLFPPPRGAINHPMCKLRVHAERACFGNSLLAANTMRNETEFVEVEPGAVTAN